MAMMALTIGPNNNFRLTSTDILYTGIAIYEGKVKDPEKENSNRAETVNREGAACGGFATLRRWLGAAISGKGNDAEAAVNNNCNGESPTLSPRISSTFDIDEALMRLGGDEPLLLDLMSKFVEIYSDAVPEIEKLLDEGKATDALRSAHTLKSVAGNVSAKNLQEVARELEMAIRESRTAGLRLLIARLNDELNTTIVVARRILESKRPASGVSEMESNSPAGPTAVGSLPAPGVDRPRLARVMGKLTNCIQEHDPVGSREALASLAAIFPGNSYNIHLDSIAAHLVCYDFEAAMQSVENLVREIQTIRNQ